MNAQTKKVVAVYTRKSTDAKIEQEVHSLSVQRAAAESFIASQKHQGWECLKEHFDDNNVSGATLDRPALERLKQLVREGQVQVVVVLRLDRLSRSLSQFLELMDFFEKHGVALVSVTQNINTGDAMGRLMLQIIMSFAEFERELIRDRVTERMHAARRLGRFIGGRPVLGYNIKPAGGELEVDGLEAIRVREIMELYLQLRSLKATACELNRRGWRNKRWVTRAGTVCGGNGFTPATLYNLLTNPVYIGKVTLKGNTYDGKHEAIIDAGLFGRIQAMLSGNSMHQGSRKRNSHAALLKGLLTCKACDAAFVHTYTKKKGRTYRYYTCANKRLNGAEACPSPSIPAGEIEALVAGQLISIGTNPGLQAEVYRQLADAMERKRSETARSRNTARQQLGHLDRELASAREFEAPLPLVKHLESKKREAEELLKSAGPDSVPPVPSREDVAKVLQDMQGLWPTFNAGEKCAFVKALVRQVDYDAVEGNLTLHFNDDGFMPASEGGAQ